MKIALCLSGLARTFKKCYQSYIDNIINLYDCDVFVFVSKDANSSDMDLIKPTKKVILEKNPSLDEKNYVKYISKKYTIQGFLQQFWKIEQCHNLMLEYGKQNNIKYDWVIRSRPDIRMKRPIDDLKSLDNSYLYIPVHHPKQTFFDQESHYRKDYVFNYNEWPSMNDRFAIGSEKLMGIYAARYAKLDEYYKWRPLMNSEFSLNGHLRLNNVKIKFLRPMHELVR
jgi:hypothetical protein